MTRGNALILKLNFTSKVAYIWTFMHCLIGNCVDLKSFFSNWNVGSNSNSNNPITHESRNIVDSHSRGVEQVIGGQEQG